MRSVPGRDLDAALLKILPGGASLRVAGHYRDTECCAVESDAILWRHGNRIRFTARRQLLYADGRRRVISERIRDGGERVIAMGE